MKKGFTLIELLGVIVILGVIALIITPVVQSTIKNSATNLCKDQVKIFEKAAKNYVAAHPYFMDGSESEAKTISLNELQEDGYLDNGDIENPRGGTFNGGVTVTFTNNKYSYHYDPGMEETRCED